MVKVVKRARDAAAPCEKIIVQNLYDRLVLKHEVVGVYVANS